MCFTFFSSERPRAHLSHLTYSPWFKSSSGAARRNGATAEALVETTENIRSHAINPPGNLIGDPIETKLSLRKAVYKSGGSVQQISVY